MRRSVTGQWDVFPDGTVTHTGWVVNGCGCPWQECEYAMWEDAITHALRCPIHGAPV